MTTQPSQQATIESISQQERTHQHRVGGAMLIAGAVLFLIGVVAGPGPDIANVHQSSWVWGHAVNAAGYLLLAIGLPSVAGSLGRRLGVAGAIGYAALLTRFILSVGSHLYSMWIMPTLAAHRELGRELTNQNHGALASIYAGHNPTINVVLGVAVLGLVFCFWQQGRGSRMLTGLLLITAIALVFTNPIALLLIVVISVWMGLRLVRRNDVTQTLRQPTTRPLTTTP